MKIFQNVERCTNFVKLVRGYMTELNRNGIRRFHVITWKDSELYRGLQKSRFIDKIEFIFCDDYTRNGGKITRQKFREILESLPKPTGLVIDEMLTTCKFVDQGYSSKKNRLAGRAQDFISDIKHYEIPMLIGYSRSKLIYMRDNEMGRLTTKCRNQWIEGSDKTVKNTDAEVIWDLCLDGLGDLLVLREYMMEYKNFSETKYSYLHGEHFGFGFDQSNSSDEMIDTLEDMSLYGKSDTDLYKRTHKPVTGNISKEVEVKDIITNLDDKICQEIGDTIKDKFKSPDDLRHLTVSYLTGTEGNLRDLVPSHMYVSDVSDYYEIPITSAMVLILTRYYMLGNSLKCQMAYHENFSNILKTPLSTLRKKMMIVNVRDNLDRSIRSGGYLVYNDENVKYIESKKYEYITT